MRNHNAFLLSRAGIEPTVPQEANQETSQI